NSAHEITLLDTDRSRGPRVLGGHRHRVQPHDVSAGAGRLLARRDWVSALRDRVPHDGQQGMIALLLALSVAEPAAPKLASVSSDRRRGALHAPEQTAPRPAPVRTTVVDNSTVTVTRLRFAPGSGET